MEATHMKTLGIPKSAKMVDREMLQAAWKKACEFDGIAPDSMFVVFSNANPFSVKYNTLMGKALAQRKAAR
jgi:hypothetical protein